MKKAYFLFVVLLTATIFSSCAKKQADTYFIHAISFEEKDGIYTIHALSEKHSDENEKYRVISQSGSSPEQAAGKLGDKYKDCYFATSETYFFDSDVLPFITTIAKQICTSNIYPSKSNIVYVEGNSKELMEKISDEHALKKVLKLCEGNRTNAVKFFSHHLSGKETSLPSVALDEKGRFKYLGLKKTQPTKE
jgi:hypothetical protein